MEHSIEKNNFWLVWSERGNPTQKHYEKAEAMLEAGRLSKKHIDTPFYIAEVQFGYVSHATINTIHLEMEEDINGSGNKVGDVNKPSPDVDLGIEVAAACYLR